MSSGSDPVGGLKLTEEEAFSLLGLCLTSPQSLDAVSEKALRKLAEYCTSRCNHSEINSIAPPVTPKRELQLDRARA
jgi:hypothetical protein